SAVLEENQPADDKAASVNNRHANLAKRIEESQVRLDQIQAKLDELPHTADANIEREQLASELKVEQAHMDLLNSFTTIFSANEDTGLAGDINKLSYSILGDLGEQQNPPAPAASKTESKETPVSSDDSIISATSDILSLSSRKRTLGAMMKDTKDLTASNQ